MERYGFKEYEVTVLAENRGPGAPFAPSEGIRFVFCVCEECGALVREGYEDNHNKLHEVAKFKVE